MPKSLSLRKRCLRRDSDFGENRIFMSLVLNKKTRQKARFFIRVPYGGRTHNLLIHNQALHL